MYMEKYTISITFNVPINIPDIYVKITVLHKMNHFTFLMKTKKNWQF